MGNLMNFLKYLLLKPKQITPLPPPLSERASVFLGRCVGWDSPALPVGRAAFLSSPNTQGTVGPALRYLTSPLSTVFPPTASHQSSFIIISVFEIAQANISRHLSYHTW